MCFHTVDLCRASIQDTPAKRTNAGAYIYNHITGFHTKKPLIAIVDKHFGVTGLVKPFVSGYQAPV
jgi:hypothetical protein